ncbi:hypothetical protein BU17DRAFT_46831, partial [Hysterangium stoloniferum]
DCAMAIKAIDSTTIHRITSGQVVVDLQTAVKELIENSLDAGATSIEVRFKDYGLKSIEIIDNGHGIPTEDYERIALKHHTSKLSTYEDLASVQTFGFRGEALSSLCALSASVTVTTATTAQAPMGTVIEFEQSGKVKSHSGKIARKRGTTVTVSGLFTPLPVRRKELERNVKREFSKALSLLHAYALVPCTREDKGVRLTVSNQPDRGTKSVQIRMDATPSLRNSAFTLWGPKALDNTIPLDIRFDVEAEQSSVLKRYGIQQQSTTTVHVQGLISKFEPGCGRTSTDRQFFFVNGRPCNPSKVQKAFNEVYRSFNANQVPFIIADFQLPTDACDINVSPDKRTIFIHSENSLLRSLKTTLESAFSASRSTFSVNEVTSAHNSRQENKAGENIRPPNGDGSLATEQEGIDNPIHNSETVMETLTNSKASGREVVDKLHCQSTTDEDVSVAAKAAACRSRTLPRSSSVCDSEKQVEFGIEPDGFDITSEHEELCSAHGVLAPLEDDISLPMDIDDDLNDSELIERGVTRQPLFAAPLPSSPPTRGRGDPSSPVPRLGRLGDSEPSTSFSPEEIIEPPRKRRRASSPVPTKAPAVQLVLGTKNAAWNLQHGGDNVPDKVKPNKSKDAIRARLTSFAMPGTQTKPIEVDEDSEEGTESEADSRLPEGEQSGEDEVESESLDTEGIQNRELGEMITEPGLIGDLLEAASLPLEPPTDIKVGSSNIPRLELVSRTPDTRSVEHPTPNEIVQTPVSTSTLRVDIMRLSSLWATIRSSSTLVAPPEPSSTLTIHATANVANEEAEKELSRVIHKQDFESMQILGQFNLGFIVTRRLVAEDHGKHSADDLFIIDQHASDEKYNFEMLQQTTKIESQKLLKPRTLELTAADEMVAMENVDVLRNNGFEVLIDENAPAGNGERIKLVAQPVSKSTTFDMKDLAELLHLMHDQPRGQMVRCSKARAMFAMRACRKSVMVGMPLTIGQMTTVVRHMGTMEQPWNCPHGRPTMRHLASLTQLDKGRLIKKEINWADFSRL